MKNILFLLLIHLSLLSYSQSDNAISYSDIKVNGHTIHQTHAAFASLFGAPSSINAFYLNELTGEILTELKYASNSFFFDNGKWVDFLLMNNSYYFYNTAIRVGNPINNVNASFPLSYQNRGVVVDKGFIIINILMNDGTLSDSKVVIVYNPINNLITAISLGTN